MNVCVQILYDSPGLDELAALESMGQCLTNRQDSVRVSAGKEPGWLVAEFTMRTEPQYRAVAKIDWEMRHYADNRLDSMIGFPKTEAERARAARKAERRRTRRRPPPAGPKDGKST